MVNQPNKKRVSNHLLKKRIEFKTSYIRPRKSYKRTAYYLAAPKHWSCNTFLQLRCSFYARVFKGI